MSIVLCVQQQKKFLAFSCPHPFWHCLTLYDGVQCPSIFAWFWHWLSQSHLIWYDKNSIMKLNVLYLQRKNSILYFAVGSRWLAVAFYEIAVAFLWELCNLPLTCCQDSAKRTCVLQTITFTSIRSTDVVHRNHEAKIGPQNKNIPGENKAEFGHFLKVFCPFRNLNVLPAKSNIPGRMIPINAPPAAELEVLRWRQFGIVGSWHAHTVIIRLCTLVVCCLSATSSNKSYSPEKTVFSLTKLTKYPASSKSRGKLVCFCDVLCKF